MPSKTIEKALELLAKEAKKNLREGIVNTSTTFITPQVNDPQPKPEVEEEPDSEFQEFSADEF
jgi:hypothetical protein